MKGYTINKSIDLLENEVEALKGSSTGGTAADISYDNTSSGLTADDVQEAIDEINTDLGSVLSGLYPTDNLEHQIGANLFIKHYSGATISQEYTVLEADFPHTILHSYGQVTSSKVGETGYRYPINQFQSATAGYEAAIFGVPGEGDSYSLQLYTDDALRGAYDAYVVYSKAVETSRKKKSK